MTKIKVKLRPSALQGRPGTLTYQVTHHSRTRQISTCYRIYPEEWDEKHVRLIPFYDERKELLWSFDQRMKQDMEFLRTIVAELESEDAPYEADEVVKRFLAATESPFFLRFMKEVIRRLKMHGQERTAETYVSAYNSFRHFRNGHDVSVHELTGELLTDYQASLLHHGVSMNTVSFYNRILRAVYNRAVAKGLTLQRYPFRTVYTGIDETLKRAVPIMKLRQIIDLDVSAKPMVDFAKDMFLFSFYTRGMSFVDMAYLRKSDLHNNILHYRRRKTGQRLIIRWEACMQAIVDKYPENPTEFLLPIIRQPGHERRQYRNALRLTNNKLKDIAAGVGLTTKLTMYVTRHSWASIAKQQAIPTTVISRCMGHSTENTTQIYLVSLDNSMLDQANETILKALLQ